MIAAIKFLSLADRVANPMVFRTMSQIFLIIVLAISSSIAEDLQTGIVHSHSIYTYVLPGGEAGVEISSMLSHRKGRVLITFHDTCTCGSPKLPSNAPFSHCRGFFPASVMQCECRQCRLSVEAKCGCEDQRWYPIDEKQCDPVGGPKKCGICTSLPENAVHHESRYKDRFPGHEINKLQGYFREKILTRCKSSCREVNAICSISMSVWRYRSAETPCTEYESQYAGVREEDGLTFKLGEGNQFSFSCPTGKLLDSSEVVQCLAGNLTANFPACKYADEVEFHNSFVHEAPVASTMETEVTTLTSEVTDLGDTPPSKQPMTKLGTLDYILVAVILAFIFILIGLWTWIIKDKRREASRKRLLSVKQATAKHYVL